MPKRNAGKTNYGFAKICNTNVYIGKIEENSQTTVKKTAWTEEEKERMRAFGYDSLDVVRAWYS